MTKEQEIDYLFNQIKALNRGGKTQDAKNAFKTLLNYAPNSIIITKAFNSFNSDVLGKSTKRLYHNIIRKQEEIKNSKS